ncbi:DUF262 domain-containing protein [Verrucomicrobium spinosum]|uniref:DUF262 domain-containing protein n=1 Tax=Verrucomicrobium spinosum TaxID=2736 RepID=UPI00017455F8|nr:DUF262 domain-containing protein [Verrucomicrobium spinosum]
MMKEFSPTEVTMWQDLPASDSGESSDSQINAKYAKRELRIVTETNREQLPNFVAALERTGWMKLQPFYQRRQRWSDERKSKLIESFIMNVPVPPCFLYESDFARYEVMDGQQRISAIWDFYTNRFRLKGLEQWPELNGRIYDNLPSEIKRGLDRRSISYVVLLRESASSSDDEMILRQQVFERLNTGGVELESQEIRHCIYHNDFDKLIIELCQHPAMRRAWKLPLYSADEETNPSPILLKTPQYTKMRDAEFVLRFFALRHAKHYRGGMQTFLDQYMVRSRRFTGVDITHLAQLFVSTIELAESIFGKLLFRPWNDKKRSWANQPQLAYADAVMVGLSSHIEDRDRLIQHREELISASKQLVVDSPAGTFTGQRNTKDAVLERINVYSKMLETFLSSKPERHV